MNRSQTSFQFNRVARFKRVTRLLPFLFLAILVTFLVRHHVFFWDTVQLGSKHAHFYYENHFSKLLLPEEIDSGHPPTFGLYIAAMWLIFGKTLTVSHFAMLPFLFGIIYFLWEIGKWIAGQDRVIFLLLLVLADPTLAAQCILVSPDVVLVCFFLMGIYAILKNQNWLKALAMLGLAMISMRGMMTVAALFLFEVSINFKNRRSLLQLLLNKLPFYLPAGIFGLTFLIWHYTQTAWIGYHSDSPWAPSFASVNAKGLLKNIAVFGWRMLDFGRVFVWMVLLYLLWQRSALKLQTVRRFFFLFIACLLILTPTALLYNALSAHRYLLPIYLSLSLLTFAAIFQSSIKKNVRLLSFLIVFLGLASGNFWIYPDKIAQGWDASLAHVPYYSLRAKMLDYIQNQPLPLDSIGTAFPEIGPLKYRDLSGREIGFAEKNLASQSYILYSNVMNDFTDEERAELQQHWQPVQVISQGGIRFVLYRKISLR